MAGATQRLQHRAFGGDGIGRVGIADHGQRFMQRNIVGQRLDPHRALRRGRQHGVDRDGHADIALVEPVKARRRQQRGMDLPRRQLGEAGGDIAAKQGDGGVGAQPHDLRGAARRTGADDRVGGQRGETFHPHQLVAHVGARQHRSDLKDGGADRFDILHAVDGEVDLLRDQRALQLLGPERLAADIGKRPVLDPVAAGLDGDDLDRVRCPAMGSDEGMGGHVRLGQRKRGASGAKAQRSVGQIHMRLALMTTGFRWKRQ